MSQYFYINTIPHGKWFVQYLCTCVCVSEISLVRWAHLFYWYVNSSCVNTIRAHFPRNIIYNLIQLYLILYLTCQYCWLLWLFVLSESDRKMARWHGQDASNVIGGRRSWKAHQHVTFVHCWFSCNQWCGSITFTATDNNYVCIKGLLLCLFNNAWTQNF